MTRWTWWELNDFRARHELAELHDEIDTMLVDARCNSQRLEILRRHVARIERIHQEPGRTWVAKQK